MGLLDLFRPKWKHSNPEVRKLAIEKINDRQLLAQIAVIDTDGEVRKAAISKIEDQNTLIQIAKNASDEDVRVAAAERFGALSLYGKDEKAVAAAFSVLVEIGGRPAIQTIHDVIRQRDWWAKWEAIDALKHLGDPAGIPALKEALLDSDGRTRSRAVAAMQELGYSGIFLSVTGDDEDYVQIAGEAPRDPEAMQFIETAIAHKSNKVRCLALRSLSPMPADWRQEQFKRAIFDDDKFVRYAACEALGSEHGEEVLHLLLGALNDTEDLVVGGAVTSLGSLGDFSAIPRLVEIMKSKGYPLHRYAFSALCSIGDPEISKPIAEYFIRKGVGSPMEEEAKELAYAAKRSPGCRQSVIEEMEAILRNVPKKSYNEYVHRAARYCLTLLGHVPDESKIADSGAAMQGPVAEKITGNLGEPYCCKSCWAEAGRSLLNLPTSARAVCNACGKSFSPEMGMVGRVGIATKSGVLVEWYCSEQCHSKGVDKLKKATTCTYCGREIMS